MGSGRTDLAVVQPKAVLKGTPEYEQKRNSLLEAFAEKVPQELRLSPELIANPPTDVSTIPGMKCGILTPSEVDITENFDASGLADAIAHKRFTAVQVAIAFSKRAIIAHQLTCCLTQWFMDDAVKQAEALDEYLHTNGTTIGPLHGVPVSIKEHMPIAGHYSSEGSIASMTFSKEDCLTVSILRKLGAVFYCKTNQPQLIMHLESTSHYGRTLNPHNIHLTSGGSSGGEAALVAMKGSVLGVGSDIGGSIRGPAAFCGIYGYKPTSDIMSLKDMVSHPMPAELNVQAATGPMCRSLRDMELFMSSVLATKPYLQDPRLIPMPWTGLKTPNTKPLKIGIIEHDEFIDPQPPVKRAIAWARTQLSKPEYSDIVQVKPFTPWNAEVAWSKIRKMFCPDGAEPARDHLASSGEPILPLTEWLLQDADRDGMLTALGVNELRGQRDAFRAEFLKSWNDQDVDIVIGPAFVGPAPAHETAFYWTYTSLYNFVDYPGVVVPTPIVAEANEKYAADYKPLSEACKQVKELWEASDFTGAPIDLQIVARRFHDNELFGALETLKDVLSLP